MAKKKTLTERVHAVEERIDFLERVSVLEEKVKNLENYKKTVNQAVLVIAVSGILLYILQNYILPYFLPTLP